MQSSFFHFRFLFTARPLIEEMNSLRWLIFYVVWMYTIICIHGEENKSIYNFEGITRGGWQKFTLACKRPERCDRYGIYGYAIDNYALIDTKRKVLMEFTPKASCTSAVIAFFESVGFEYGVDYKGWPHVFRDRYYNPRCGHATACHYLNPNWFRFKVVRNPYERAVSSYLYIMNTPMFIPFLPPVGNASFEQFIDYLATLPLHEFQEYATRHAAPQSQNYERYAFEKNLPPIFHVIVKAEESEIGIQAIYDRVGVRYELKPLVKHHQTRDDSVQKYVGNLSWIDVRDQVPKSYGYFYSHSLKKKVETLYKWDLQLYNYTYPFNTPLI